MKYCKDCNQELNSENEVRVGKYIRNICKKCRSKRVMIYAKDNKDRKFYMTDYLLRKGKVKSYPCENCDKLCTKKYDRAFCSDQCRFISFIDTTPDNGCWVWKGGKGRHGYGKFMLIDKLDVASRWSFENYEGPISEGMLICHSCDNPPCGNPEHLWQGTNSENQIDIINKQRNRWNKYPDGVKLCH